MAMTATQRARRWRANNREHCREYGDRQRRRRREELNSYARAYYLANREKIRARQNKYLRAYRSVNRDLLAKKQRQRVDANPKKALARNRSWRARNVAPRMFYQDERRALIRNLPGINDQQLSKLKSKVAT